MEQNTETCQLDSNLQKLVSWFPKLDFSMPVFDELKSLVSGGGEGTVANYIAKFLMRTTEILRSQEHLNPSVVTLFAKQGLRDELLPFSSHQVSFLPEEFQKSYLDAQQKMLATRFGIGEHKDLAVWDSTPFLVLPRDRSKIRSGCFGDVCRVFEGETAYALKTIKGYDAMQRERKILSLLPRECPHVLKLRASYIQQDKYCLVLDPWVEYDLKEFFSKRDSFPWWQKIKEDGKVLDVVIGWMTCLASGIATLHSYRLRYMDFKPDNIGLHMLGDGDGDIIPILLDYDCYVSSYSNSQSQDPSGNQFYASPEKLQRKEEGRKGDIFSLGLIFCDLLTIIDSKWKNKWRKATKGCKVAAQALKGGTKYHATSTKDLLSNFPDDEPWISLKPLLRDMLSMDQGERPAAMTVWEAMKDLQLCLHLSCHCTELLLKPPTPEKKSEHPQIVDPVRKLQLGDLEEENADALEDEEDEEEYRYY